MGIPRTGPAVKAVLGLEGSKHTDQGLELKLVLGDKSFSFVWVFEYAVEPGQKIFSLTLDGFSLDYSIEQTLAMSSTQSGGRYVIRDDVVYGLFIHPTDGTPAFASAPIEVSDTGFNIGEPTVILDDVFASWIAEEDDYLYFSMNVDRTDGHQVGVARVPVGGTDVEVLYEYVAPYLIVRNGKLYYTDDMHYLRSMNVDGTGDEPVLGKPVYYPYLLDDTWLVYQDDEDGETLHLYGLGSTCDERITEYRSYCPIAYDKYLYFTDYQAEDEVRHLCRLDTETWEKEDGQSPVTGGFFITEGCIYLGGGSITAGPDVLTGDEPTTSAANPGLQGRGLRGPLRGQRRRRDSLHAHQGHPRPLRLAERQALARRLAQSPKSKAAWALRKGDRT